VRTSHTHTLPPLQPLASSIAGAQLQRQVPLLVLLLLLLLPFIVNARLTIER
jgi:hypothetical protein